MADGDERRVHAFVTGIVQGVWYRASTQREAQALGLRGWVRNVADGRVEFAAEGPSGAVDRLLEWARGGPRDARVDDLTVREEEPTGDEASFEILR